MAQVISIATQNPISLRPIDKLFDYKFGHLQYRSMKYSYVRNEHWEKDSYGTINLPQHQKYIRKCNFKVLHKSKSPHNWIQYQEPIAADNNFLPMYPINTKENDDLFDKYLKEQLFNEESNQIKMIHTKIAKDIGYKNAESVRSILKRVRKG